MENTKQLNNIHDISISEILDKHALLLYDTIADYIVDLDINDLQLYTHKDKNGYVNGITFRQIKANKTKDIILLDISIKALDDAITQSKIIMFDKIYDNQNDLL